MGRVKDCVEHCVFTYTFIIPLIVGVAFYGICMVLKIPFTFSLVLFFVSIALAFAFYGGAYSLALMGLVILILLFTFDFSVFPEDNVIIQLVTWWQALKMLASQFIINVANVFLGGAIGRLGRTIFDYMTCQECRKMIV